MNTEKKSVYRQGKKLNQYLKALIGKTLRKIEETKQPDDITYSLFSETVCEKLNESCLSHKRNIFKHFQSNSEKWKFIKEGRNSKT